MTKTEWIKLLKTDVKKFNQLRKENNYEWLDLSELASSYFDIKTSNVMILLDEVINFAMFNIPEFKNQIGSC